MLLTIGLAVVFGWFGIDKFLTPLIWIGWMPLWMEGLMGMPTETWLKIVGVSEIIMALLIIIPIRKVRMVGAVLIALHLVAILTQTGWSDIGVRDTGLLFSALALLFLL